MSHCPDLHDVSIDMMSHVSCCVHLHIPEVHINILLFDNNMHPLRTLIPIQHILHVPRRAHRQQTTRNVPKEYITLSAQNKVDRVGEKEIGTLKGFLQLV